MKQGVLNVNHIQFVEFLELVARVADTYLQDVDFPLHTKINFVLDEWLPIVGHEREEPRYFEDGLPTDSDYYDDDVKPTLLKLRLSKKLN